MIDRVQASAPAKVILAGEYSVLAGGPALVLAVDRRIQLTFDRGQSGLLHIAAPGFADGLYSVDLNLDHRGASGEKLAMSVDLINRLIDSDVSYRDFRDYSGRLTLDSRAFYGGENKLGLGSSAALTVALDELLAKLFTRPQESLNERWQRLHAVHSHVQGKQGSGVDIAASLRGGLSIFQRRRKASCVIRAGELPARLNVAYIWTGSSASTPAYLQSLSDWRINNTAAYDTCMGRLVDATEYLTAQHDAVCFLDGLRAFTQALWHFDQLSQLGIFASGHDDLWALSQAYSTLVYKPCGAGGGDLGIVVTDNAQDLAQFVEQAGRMGKQHLTLNMSALGAY